MTDRTNKIIDDLSRDVQIATIAFALEVIKAAPSIDEAKTVLTRRMRFLQESARE